MFWFLVCGEFGEFGIVCFGFLYWSDRLLVCFDFGVGVEVLCVLPVDGLCCFWGFLL